MPAPRTVTLDSANGRYDVTVQPGLLADIGPRVAAISKSTKACVLTDAHVGPIYADALSASLRSAGVEPVVATIGAGENNKTLAALLPAYDVFLSARIDRQTPVIALGGGLVGDMAGFVAATLLRGVPFIQVPTTLLAMVDASVGGKTGVNHAVGKNLIGAFHQPVAVLIDPQVLRTLPPRELRGGLAECIKHDLIRDADGFDRLERDLYKARSLNIDYLADLVAHNVAIKARVVEADPFERGDRAHLNLGHTFGHAIETVSNYEYSHGEAVAMGIVAASRMAMSLDLIDIESVNRICGVIIKAGLPVDGPKKPELVEPLLAALHFDKKVSAGKVRFVLPNGIGNVIIRDDVPADNVRRAAEYIFG